MGLFRSRFRSRKKYRGMGKMPMRLTGRMPVLHKPRGGHPNGRRENPGLHPGLGSPVPLGRRNDEEIRNQSPRQKIRSLTSQLFPNFLLDEDDDAVRQLRNRTRTGRPCGHERFLRTLETKTGRSRQRKKTGPKTEKKNNDTKSE